MSNFIFRILSSIFNDDSNKRPVVPAKPVKSDFLSTPTTAEPPSNNSNDLIWRKDLEPLRKIILWGFDDENNPSFLILYGRHEFASKHKDPKGYYILKDKIKFTSYAIFHGKNGHLPSFEAVEIVESKKSEMYYKRGIRNRWSRDKNYLVKEYTNLGSTEFINIPYAKELSYDECLNMILSQKSSFPGFRPAKNPNEILMIEEQHSKYFQAITEMLSNDNIYMRKKILSELLSYNPPFEIYETLIKVGSTELVSGLFMELGKARNPILIKQAKDMVDMGIDWAQESYGNGVIRCAKLYINALDNDLRTERTNWINKTLSLMDFHLIHIKDKDIPEDKIIEGHIYRQYANKGLLVDQYRRYDYKKREYITLPMQRRFKQGPYTDGIKIKLIDFKNTIQEAEVYGLADVIGKIAYYLDSPRVTYYLKGSGKSKALAYFRRYIKRVINSYAKNSPDKFMEAMLNLLISYNSYDYTCKFPYNFQYNKLLKYYLYHEFNVKAPGWSSWSERYDFITNDQLLKLQGRFEYMKEIWDNNLDLVADIAIGANIPQVTKACYYILKDSPNSRAFIENINPKRLISLSYVAYKPLADMFKDILQQKLSTMNSFDAEFMLGLMDATDIQLHKYALEYFKRTNGMFSPQIIADMLFMENIDTWTELFKDNVNLMNETQYVEFIKYLFESLNKLKKLDKEPSEAIRDSLSASTVKIQNTSIDLKIRITSECLSTLSKDKIPNWFGDFMEEVVFSLKYPELESLLKDKQIETSLTGNSRYRRIVSILESIKNKTMISDPLLINVLEKGTSKTISIMIELLSRRAELKNRFTTLLIMLESDITVLNRIASQVFDDIPNELQRKIHMMIIDSPVKKAYTFGLSRLDTIYNEYTPEEFIIHMMEHGSEPVKAYVSNKLETIVKNLEKCNPDLFMYYLKTLLLLPNKLSKSKDSLCGVVPEFVTYHTNKLDEIENLLLDIGGSYTTNDAERALVTLAKIKGGMAS